MKPIVWNGGALTLPPRRISVISVQAPTELNMKHLYQLYTANDPLTGIIILAVNHKIYHKCPKSPKVSLPNRDHDTIHIPRKPS